MSLRQTDRRRPEQRHQEQLDEACGTDAKLPPGRTLNVPEPEKMRQGLAYALAADVLAVSLPQPSRMPSLDQSEHVLTQPLPER